MERQNILFLTLCMGHINEFHGTGREGQFTKCGKIWYLTSKLKVRDLAGKYIYVYICTYMLKKKLSYLILWDVYWQHFLCLLATVNMAISSFFISKNRLLKIFLTWYGKQYFFYLKVIWVDFLCIWCSLSSRLAYHVDHLFTSFFPFSTKTVDRFRRMAGDDVMKVIYYVLCSLGIWESSKPAFKGKHFWQSRWKESSPTGLVIALIL